MVAVTGISVGLMPTKAGILPMPDAPNPILVLLLVQVYTVVGIDPVNTTAAVLVPAHTVWFATAFTVGVGFTVMVKLTGKLPPQPFADGVTVMVAVMGALVALVATKLAMLPVPDAARPMAVLLLVQL